MTTSGMFDIADFLSRQLMEWPEARANYEALGQCETARVTDDYGNQVEIRFNPARIRSSAAKTDSASVARRPCFLCKANRPAQQIAVDFGNYELLLNPYPVFSTHFTIAAKEHVAQQIAGHLADMLEIARQLEGMTVFYNGPRCGASAPDHLHFQAVPSDLLPMWQSIREGKPWIVSTIHVEDSDPVRVIEITEGHLWRLRPGDEPDVNIYARYDDGIYYVVIIPRRAHRPTCYGAGPGECLISPASVEMAGVIVAPRMQDFDFAQLHGLDILRDTGFTELPDMNERTLDVGITEAGSLEVILHGAFSASDGTVFKDSTLKFGYCDGKIECGATLYDDYTLTPLHGDQCSFTLRNVMIGIGFHWQQHEDQSFHGELCIKALDGRLVAVNRVKIETYLRSVVSSEMNATAPEEFLKAHAVISRSWVLAQVLPPAHLADHSFIDSTEEKKIWYDRDAHTHFDICADDHCQRYQGCTKASTPQVDAALEATRGEVFAFGNDLCDARFSKCCGGTTELFSTCWQDVDLPYLQAVDDPYCGRASDNVLKTVLNNYDQTTTDYYRWEVEYTATRLASIIHKRTGIDFGQILALTPLHRGPSGRIDRLEIRGTKLTRIIGKELEIRRSLSETHLYSSAFDVEIIDRDADGTPLRWKLTGRGWGHGVGLCQIGAAVMAAEGFTYREILNHYFPGARIITIY